jgi:hypothetical protein
MEELTELLMEDRLCTIVTTASDNEQTLSAATCRLNFLAFAGDVRRLCISRTTAGQTDPTDGSRSVTVVGESRRTSKAFIARDMPAW